MKKSLLVFIFCLSFILLHISCAKEKNGRDAALTNSYWLLNNASLHVTSSEKITADEILGISGTSTIDSGIEYHQNTLTSTKQITNQPENAEQSWEKEIATYAYFRRIKFEENGHYEMTIRSSLSKTSHSTNTIQDPDYFSTGDTLSTTISGSWYWANTTETKQSIFVERFGTFNIQVDENLLTLRRVLNSSKTYDSKYGVHDIRVTDNTNQLEAWHFSPQ